MLRPLDLADMDAAARVCRVSFDQALPWLTGLHTPEKDRCFFRQRLFVSCRLWGAFDGGRLLGVIAFRPGWVDQLYVLPQAQGKGLGTALLQVAQRSFARLQVWTFQRNRTARQFYTHRGFWLVRETDGSRNEEREPDVLYRWLRKERAEKQTRGSAGPR